MAKKKVQDQERRILSMQRISNTLHGRKVKPDDDIGHFAKPSHLFHEINDNWVAIKHTSSKNGVN